MHIADGKIEIDVGEFVKCFNEDDTKKLIKTLAIESYVIEKVIDYICDEDEDGWWTSDADNWRMELLRRVEDAQIEKWSKYNWQFIDEAIERLKEIKEKEHIYKHLYHNPFGGKSHHEIMRWLDEIGAVSQYTTKQADKEIKEIYDIVQNAMDNMKERKNEH